MKYSTFFPEVKHSTVDFELTPAQVDGYNLASPAMPRYNEGTQAGTHQGVKGGSREGKQ